MRQEQLDNLFTEMVSYFNGDPKRIQHFIKVHSFARLIGIQEKIEDKELFIVEAAAYVHDIGIRLGEEQFGRNDGKIQEQLGPKAAEEILERLDFSQEVIKRVSYLVGHHHTYIDMDGIDYHILVEADFLVNLYEDACSKEAIKTAYDKIFTTNGGKKLLKEIYLMDN